MKIEILFLKKTILKLSEILNALGKKNYKDVSKQFKI